MSGMEMSGSQQALDQMVEHMVMGGRIAMLGIPPGKSPVDWRRIVFKAITIKGVYGREIFETWYKMIAMLENGLDIRRVITHRFKVDDFQRRLRRHALGPVRQGRAGLDLTRARTAKPLSLRPNIPAGGPSRAVLRPSRRTARQRVFAPQGAHSKTAPTRDSSASAHGGSRRPRNAPKWPDRVNPPVTISRLTGGMDKESSIMDGSHPAGFAEAPAAAFRRKRPCEFPLAGTIAEGKRFRVRTLRLAPGEATSLQSHLHRSEHWVVVEGTAEVTLGIHSRLVGEGEAIHIPLGQRHRLENPGRLPVTLIAVETGRYLGDDDAFRHD